VGFTLHSRCARQESLLQKAEVAILGDNDVVQNAYVHSPRCLNHSAGNILVFLRRLCMPARVIMHQQQCRSMVRQCRFYDAPRVDYGAVNSAHLSAPAYSPTRNSLMLDYAPSEYSLVRLQLAQDKSRQGVTDNQLFLQYIMSLGAHGAHKF